MSGHRPWSELRDSRRFRDATGVDRHLNLYCPCPLLDCCHNEDQEPCERGPHAHSGNPATGYLYPWTQEEWDAQQRYWNRPDPDEYPEGTLELLVAEAELEEWRERERDRRAGFVRAYECGTTEPAAPREAAGELSQVSGGGSGI